HRNTVANWLGQYEEGGLEGLRKVGEPGPEPGQTSIPPQAMEALKEQLGQPEGFESYHEIRDWLDEQFGVDLCYSTVHGIVRYQIGAKPKVPRPRHVKKTKMIN